MIAEHNRRVAQQPAPAWPPKGRLAKASAERVVVKSGTNTTEFVYGDFQDFNNPLFKIEALYAGTMVERRNGTVVRDLKSRVTEIGQIYVVMPVPDSVRKAGK